MLKRLASVVIAVVVVFAATVAGAQQAPPEYGPGISLEQAKKVMAAAEAEAVKNKWNVVITIVDSGGNIMMVHRLDNTQFGSVDVARDKAFSPVAFRRPTKVFQEGVTSQQDAQIAQAGIDALGR